MSVIVRPTGDGTEIGTSVLLAEICFMRAQLGFFLAFPIGLLAILVVLGAFRGFDFTLGPFALLRALNGLGVLSAVGGFLAIFRAFGLPRALNGLGVLSAVGGFSRRLIRTGDADLQRDGFSRCVRCARHFRVSVGYFLRIVRSSGLYHLLCRFFHTIGLRSGLGAIVCKCRDRAQRNNHQDAQQQGNRSSHFCLPLFVNTNLYDPTFFVHAALTLLWFHRLPYPQYPAGSTWINHNDDHAAAVSWPVQMGAHMCIILHHIYPYALYNARKIMSRYFLNNTPE